MSLNQSTTLRSVFENRNLYIGAAVDIELLQTDKDYLELLRKEFNMVTPENAMKWWALQPKRDEFVFDDADEIVSFAKENNMAIRGHTLVWDKGFPKWLKEGDFKSEEIKEIVKNHVQAVAKHFRGKFYCWDVINEALNSKGLDENMFLFNHLGPKYVGLIFRWAHEADPNVKLFYNEWGADRPNNKFEALYKLVAGLIEEGVPIHGVGLQMHVGLGNPRLTGKYPAPGEVKNVIERLGRLGLEVHITEMDVQIQGGVGSHEERLREQAMAYKNILQEAISCSNFKALVQWGVEDKHSWIHEFTGEHDAPLLFDENYQPKPAYFAVKELLD